MKCSLERKGKNFAFALLGGSESQEGSISSSVVSAHSQPRLLRVSSPREARIHGLETQGVVDMVEDFSVLVFLKSLFTMGPLAVTLPGT